MTTDKQQEVAQTLPLTGGAGGGLVIVFSAPSASGKSTLVNYLLEQGVPLHFSVSATSRPARPLQDGTMEQHGVHYFFLTPDEFRAHIEAGDFLEYEEVYADRFYGTLKQQVDAQLADGQNVICDVDVKGGVNIKRHYGDRCLSIFIQAPSLEEIERRLRSRGTDDEESIRKRLDRAAYELTFAPQFDRVIVNDDLATAQAEILKVVTDFISPLPTSPVLAQASVAHTGRRARGGAGSN